MSPEIVESLALTVVLIAPVVVLVVWGIRDRRARQHEWHRYGLGYKRRRKRPDGAFEYRDETAQEGKEDQDLNAW